MTPHDFIAKWNGADGSERANYPLFFNDLCDLLGVGKPQPAQADDWHNAYVNERWAGQPDDATLLERLVALNAERAREEADGSVRWLRQDHPQGECLAASSLRGLRPAFQHAASAPAAASQKLDLPETAVAAPPAAKLPWPADLPGQLGAVAQVLKDAGVPIRVDALAARFAGKRGLAKTLPGLLAALEAVARAQKHADGSYSAA